MCCHINGEWGGSIWNSRPINWLCGSGSNLVVVCDLPVWLELWFSGGGWVGLKLCSFSNQHAHVGYVVAGSTNYVMEVREKTGV